MTPANLVRLASDYSQLDTSAPFNASDAISLAHFVNTYANTPDNAHVSRLRAYYGAAWSAITLALQLPYADQALRRLHAPFRASGAPERESFFRSSLEPFFFRTLVDARRNIVDFVRFHANVCEGDPWGASLSRREALRAPLETAQAWYDGASKSVLEGLLPIDQALCAMIGWDGSRVVSFETLRRHYGWEAPAVDEVREYWM